MVGQHAVADVAALAGEEVVERVADRRPPDDRAVDVGERGTCPARGAPARRRRGDGRRAGARSRSNGLAGLVPEREREPLARQRLVARRRTPASSAAPQRAQAQARHGADLVITTWAYASVKPSRDRLRAESPGGTAVDGGEVAARARRRRPCGGAAARLHAAPATGRRRRRAAEPADAVVAHAASRSRAARRRGRRRSRSRRATACSARAYSSLTTASSGVADLVAGASTAEPLGQRRRRRPRAPSSRVRRRHRLVEPHRVDVAEPRHDVAPPDEPLEQRRRAPRRDLDRRRHARTRRRTRSISSRPSSSMSSSVTPTARLT